MGSSDLLVQQKQAFGPFLQFDMKLIILFVLFVALSFSAGADLTRESETRGKPKSCKNPKGKIGSSVLRGCARATCLKTKKGALWDECPMAATEESMNTQLAALKAGQDTLEDGQEDLKAGQADLKVGQTDLKAGQAAIENGQAALEAGQRALAELIKEECGPRATTYWDWPTPTAGPGGEYPIVMT